LVRAGDVRVRPDVVFTRQRLAVFVDGCFWHSCPEHRHVPKRNVEYWIPKLAANHERDGRVNVALEHNGWLVERIWEHVPIDDAVEVVEARLRERRAHPAKGM
jgi:DNA mismatch endonuclease (patch repair protein)